MVTRDGSSSKSKAGQQESGERESGSEEEEDAMGD
jgi:hypothetical protein